MTECKYLSPSPLATRVALPWSLKHKQVNRGEWRKERIGNKKKRKRKKMLRYWAITSMSSWARKWCEGMRSWMHSWTLRYLRRYQKTKLINHCMLQEEMRSSQLLPILRPFPIRLLPPKSLLNPYSKPPILPLSNPLQQEPRDYLTFRLLNLSRTCSQTRESTPIPTMTLHAKSALLYLKHIIWVEQYPHLLRNPN